MAGPAYRYTLERKLGRPRLSRAERRVLFCMLNPSTADDRTDDQTIRRLKGFARREGGTLLRVVNLYAARATYPDRLAEFQDPIGPDNDETIRLEALRADLIIAAWGVPPRGLHPAREQTVLALLKNSADVYRLGPVTMAGHPRHPVRLSSGTPLMLHVRRNLS